MSRKLLICFGTAAVLAAAAGEVRAAPLCEPELRPEACIPGISTSPECLAHDPADAPPGTIVLAASAPDLLLPVTLPAPAPGVRRLAVARDAIGAAHPGFARGIDRPPKRAS